MNLQRYKGIVWDRIRSAVWVQCRSQCRGTCSLNSSRGNLFGRDHRDILTIVQDMGHPAYRSRQIREWIYAKGATMFQDMSNLPQTLQQELEKSYAIDYGRVIGSQQSVDQTRKMLVQFNNDPRAAAEVVFIPEKHRGTLCVSSQVGCSLSCKFCHTGTQSLYRNLTAAEIVGQYMIAAWIEGDFPRKTGRQHRVSNIVFMGQGEPLYNFRNVSAAIGLLTDKDGIALAPWRITISTSGVAPLIPRIASELQVGLAISLHTADTDLRSEIMPINKTYPLSLLMSSCAEFVKLAGPHNRRITFEYVMLDGVNDADSDAVRLVNLIKDFPAHVNLIPFNPWPGSIYTSSSTTRVAAFCNYVRSQGIHASIRTPRGEDILAACGQLKSIHEKPAEIFS
ncbi:radical SAM family enzyme [Coemansia reversa NRRL 1564]|uniref:Radical SAM family enzyme n=1 Tax=Coemansia reversa (strain ATCC 12441 / NRRL 1564) TaxID=763665 RepID=A0A2G5BJ49_COERN|nr:radical SAM family enzyme [Coemansia reversa NRRL 1564]|eukprot:PIA19035.1 radical SAM family enzyme [Coemansia reversa NRRL 1564]